VKEWFTEMQARGFDKNRCILLYAIDGWGMMKYINKALSERFLKTNLTEDQLKRVIFRPDGFLDEAIALGVDNSYTGYVYLIDQNGKVRWSASGPPSSPSEVDMVCSFVDSLTPLSKKSKYK
jgi:hypothetical protein